MTTYQRRRAPRGEPLGTCPACKPGKVYFSGERYYCDNGDFLIFDRCLSHLGKTRVSIEEMTALLNDAFPWLEGMINRNGEEYGGFAYLVEHRDRWVIRFNWWAPERPMPLSSYSQPVRTKRLTPTAIDRMEIHNNCEKED